MASPSILDNCLNSSQDIPWIHCNSCYKLYEKNHNFYLLSCSDVMCRNCFKKGGRKPFCTICKKHVSFKNINEQLEPKYLKLFKLDINYDSYAEEFQYKHALHLAKKLAKEEKIAEENKQNMKKLIQYNEEYKKLRAERKQKQERLKRILDNMRRQTNLTTPIRSDRASEIGSSSIAKSNRVLSQNSSLFSIPSIINKTTSNSFIQTESAKQFFQNRGPTSSGNKAPFRKKNDLSSTSMFNTHFKPPVKSTPII